MSCYNAYYTYGKCGFRMRRHRPNGSLKYPGPHFRLFVLPALGLYGAAAAVAAVAAGVVAVAAAGVVAAAGGSDVLPLLAISASTI